MTAEPGEIEAAGRIGLRYGPLAAREWELFLSGISLGVGFALFVLLVPDRDGAALCRQELARHLASEGLDLVELRVGKPQDLLAAVTALRLMRPETRRGGAWLAGVAQTSDADFEAWRDAWARTLQALNLNRNVLMRELECPWVIAVAPWLVPLFRETAPDLWSVRSRVVRILLDAAMPRGRHEEHARLPDPRRATGSEPDPALAFQAAARLRGVTGREGEMARLLVRASRGLRGRGDPGGAEAAAREAVAALGERADADALARSEAWAALGEALLAQGAGRGREAEAAFRRTLSLEAEAGESAVSRGGTLLQIGAALRAQNRAPDAQMVVRDALALIEEGGGTTVSRGIATHDLGLALLAQDRGTEAEAAFRRALALAEEGGDSALSRCITTHELGRALLAQGRAVEAEAALRGALGLLAPTPETAGSRSSIMHDLGRALRKQGRLADAEEAFETALGMTEHDDGMAESRGITRHELGRALMDQGRAVEAEAVLRSALDLVEQGGGTALSRGFIMDDLGRALREQGRADEAEALLRGALDLVEQGGGTAASRSVILHDLGRGAAGPAPPGRGGGDLSTRTATDGGG